MKTIVLDAAKIRENASEEWSSLTAMKGESAYEIAVRRGYQGTEAQWVNALETERAAAVASIQNKGETTLASIPNDYTTLNNTVNEVIHSGFNQHVRYPFEGGTLSTGIGYVSGYRASREILQNGKLKLTRSTSEPTATSFGTAFTVETDANVDLTGHKILFSISDVDLSGVQDFKSMTGWTQMNGSTAGNISYTIASVQAGETYYYLCTPSANINRFYITVVGNNAHSEGEYFTIGSLQWFDLTEMFGAGNEPDMNTFLSVYESGMPYGLIMPSSTDYNKATKALISDALYPTKALADNMLLQNGTEFAGYIGSANTNIVSSSVSKTKYYQVKRGQKYYVYATGNRLLVAGFNTFASGATGERYIFDNDNANVMHSFVATKPIAAVYYASTCSNSNCFLYADTSMESNVYGIDPEERALYKEDVMACAASYLVHEKNCTCVVGTPTGIDTPYVAWYGVTRGYDGMWRTGNSYTVWSPTAGYDYKTTKEYNGVAYPCLYVNTANFVMLLTKCIPYNESPMYYAFNHINNIDFDTMSNLALGNGTYATKPYTIDMHHRIGYNSNEIAFCENHSGNRLYKLYDGTSFDSRVYDMLETGDIIYFGSQNSDYASNYKHISSMYLFVKSLDDINKYGTQYGVTFRSSQKYAPDSVAAHGYLFGADSTIDGEDCIRIVSIDSYIAQVSPEALYAQKANATPFNSTKAAGYTFNVVEHALYL